MPHILMVDDDREIRDLLAQVFWSGTDFSVTAVRDGREARRAWPLGHYQLVVLDLMLPGREWPGSGALAARRRAMCRS